MEDWVTVNSNNVAEVLQNTGANKNQLLMIVIPAAMKHHQEDNFVGMSAEMLRQYCAQHWLEWPEIRDGVTSTYDNTVVELEEGLVGPAAIAGGGPAHEDAPDEDAPFDEDDVMDAIDDERQVVINQGIPEINIINFEGGLTTPNLFGKDLRKREFQVEPSLLQEIQAGAAPAMAKTGATLGLQRGLFRKEGTDLKVLTKEVGRMSNFDNPRVAKTAVKSDDDLFKFAASISDIACKAVEVESKRRQGEDVIEDMRVLLALIFHLVDTVHAMRQEAEAEAIGMNTKYLKEDATTLTTAQFDKVNIAAKTRTALKEAKGGFKRPIRSNYYGKQFNDNGYSRNGGGNGNYVSGGGYRGNRGGRGGGRGGRGGRGTYSGRGGYNGYGGGQHDQGSGKPKQY